MLAPRAIFSVLKIAPAIILLLCAGYAQATQSPVVQNSRARVSTRTKLSSQQEQALKILRTQDEVTKGLSPAMRTFALFEIARGFEAIHDAKTLPTLNDAFQSSQAIEDDNGNGRVKSVLQNLILQRIVKLDPAAGERLLPQLSGPPRKEVIVQLMKKYADEKQFGRAVSLLNQLGDEEFPYIPVSSLMEQLPVQMAAQRQDLFAQALSSYSQHEHKGEAGIGDFDVFVSRTWQKMPPDMVLQAIDEILKQARDSDTQMSITVGAAAGAASFGSTYEYSLFEVLPILRQLDPDRADRLLQEHQNLQSVIDHFPKGFGTPDSMTMRLSGNNDSSASDRYQEELQRQANKIMTDANENPKQALAAVMSLPDFHDSRLRAILGLASTLQKTAPSQAREALSEALKLIPSEKDEFNQGQSLTQVANIYLQLKDVAAAKDAIDRGFKLAEKLYDSDTDAADPNQVFKAAWPSTATWSKFISLLARTSSQEAFHSISKIPDPDIQAIQKITFANVLLKVSPDVQMVVVKTKEKNFMMMSPE